MSQASIVINGGQDGTGYTGDLNSALQSIVTLSSGPTEPATMYPYMLWANTTSNLLMQRNSSNNGWLYVCKLADILMSRDMSQIYVADSGGANTIVVAPSPAFSAYTTSIMLLIKVNTTNSGAVTINVNGLGIKALRKADGVTALTSGDIVAGQIIQVVYDGTNFQLTSPSATVAVPDGSVTLAKMASQTAGSLITFNSSNQPALVSTGTAGQFLRSNGAGAAPSMQTVGLNNLSNVQNTTPSDGQVLKWSTANGRWEPASGGVLTSTYATTNGSFVVPTGITRLWIRVIGAGGAGRSAGNGNGTYYRTGGGAGGVVMGWLNVTSGETISYTIGVGGITSQMEVGLNDGSGGNTVFGSYATAYGGKGGQYANNDATILGIGGVGTFASGQNGLQVMGGSSSGAAVMNSGVSEGGRFCGGKGGQYKVGGGYNANTADMVGAGGCLGQFTGGSGDNGANGAVYIAYFA